MGDEPCSLSGDSLHVWWTTWATAYQNISNTPDVTELGQTHAIESGTYGRPLGVGCHSRSGRSGGATPVDRPTSPPGPDQNLGNDRQGRSPATLDENLRVLVS